MIECQVQSRKRLLVVSWVLLGSVCAGCDQGSVGTSDTLALSGSTMGTRYSIKCWSEGPTLDSSRLQTDIDALLEDINQQMSTYLPDSELSRFNLSRANDWFEVSAATALVVDKALHFHEITGGASDVTVGPLVRLWDFGPGRHAVGTVLAAPSEDSIATALEQAGAEKLNVRLDPPALQKAVDKLEVDLSSIAKGYAADAVAELLLDHGYGNFMVEIGGEVQALGTRPDGKAWRIGVEKPDLTRRALHNVVPLKNQALATSGDYRNFREFDGRMVSHIIDPRTGRPLPYRGWSITVLAPTCLEADALATALLVMGEQRGYDWCEEHEVAALFLIREGDEIIEMATSQFPKLKPLHENNR